MTTRRAGRPARRAFDLGNITLSLPVACMTGSKPCLGPNQRYMIAQVISYPAHPLEGISASSL